jgi:hypothetical protein
MARAMREVTICDFDDQLATTTINFKGPGGRTTNSMSASRSSPTALRP